MHPIGEKKGLLLGDPYNRGGKSGLEKTIVRCRARRRKLKPAIRTFLKEIAQSEEQACYGRGQTTVTEEKVTIDSSSAN